MTQILSTQITAVTVYSQQALVTRQGTVELTPDDRELVVAELPTTLKPDSVRVSGQGTGAVQILGVRTDRVFATESTAPKVAELEAQLQALEDQKKALGNRMESLKIQQRFVEGLSEAAVGRFSLSLAKQETNLTETQALLNFFGERYQDYGGTIAQLDQEERDLNQQIAVVHHQLKQLHRTRPHESFSIFVKIATAVTSNFNLEVSYQVDKASWQPLYDLQVDTITHVLTLNYLADVQQNTGEDWQNVVLTLSTAKPSLGSLPPKLNPWYVDLWSPPPPPATAMRMEKFSSDITAISLAAPGAARVPMGGVSDDEDDPFLDLYADDEAVYEEAKTVTAKVDRSGGVATFQVGGNSDIPSDNNPHNVTLFRDEYPAQLQYVAIPSLVSFAYLQASVTNPQDKVTLLPGKANIFRDGAFVGTTQLENVAPGQTFEVNLGIEERLTLERDLVERQVDKKLLSLEAKRRIMFAYRLSITNLLEQAAELKLTEQLPVSRNEKVKIRLMQSSPKIELGEMGILEWNLNLAADSKQQIYYQFLVEYPADRKLTGLDT
jgi:uncharacterized protein (TIGR02231 family)